MGVSPDHASTIGDILNLQTKSITPQFHVVYDDDFTIVSATTDNVPPNWDDLIIHHGERVLEPTDNGPPLAEEWLDEDELALRRAQREEIRPRRAPNIHRELPASQPPLPTPERATIIAPEGATNLGNDFDAEPMDLPPTQQPVAAPPTPIPSPPSPPIRQVRFSDAPTEPIRSGSAEASFRLPPLITTRSGRVTRPPSRLSPMPSQKRYSSESYFTPHCSLAQAFVAMEEILTNPDTNELDGIHPMAFASKPTSEDTPLYHEAMAGPHKEKFCEAMFTEIEELEAKKTWSLVNRPKGKTVLPGTWAFKIKRYPDGRIRKYKARFCVRGDRQTDCIEAFDTYAPVVQWSTVRLMMTMASVMNLKSVQVDYNNAFAQARLKEPIYVEIPRGFRANDDGTKVLMLHSSLYGLRQAAERWFDKISTGLIKRGFQQSAIDPCLFFHKNMICLIYVDDCLFFARNEADIHAMIKDLRKEFDLVVEDDVSTYLGIKIKKLADDRLEMSQPYLIERILEATGMKDCNGKSTPALEFPIGTDKEGADRQDEWSYASVIGMLMFLQANTRPDISFAVHQCARFTHNPKKSHEEAVKHICRYLQGTKEKGIIYRPTKDLSLDCYVDADFAGLWHAEDDQDPTCVRSRTGYVITFGGCPLLWVSRLQTEIALSTTEAEYIALSQSMRDLLSLKRVVTEIVESFGKDLRQTATHSTVFEDNNGALSLAHTPAMTPRSKHIAVKYHFFREHVRRGTMVVKKIDTDKQKADILTKGLGRIKFERIREMLIGW
ncbi:MAG: reverse transcriptase domain-containing protein [bacterium]